MPQINSTGRYRGRIISWGLQDARESQSVGIYIKCQVNQIFNEATNQWEDLSYGDQQGPWEAEGTIYIINRMGQPLQEQAERFMQATGWTGRIEQITGEEQWDPLDIQFTVDENVYKGRTSYRIGFVNPYDHQGRGQISPDKVKSIKQRFGSQFRAMGQNHARNAPKPQPAPTPVVATPVAAAPVAVEAPAVPQRTVTETISSPPEDGSYQGPDGKWYTKDGQLIPF